MSERWMDVFWYDFQAHIAGTVNDGVKVLVVINDEQFKTEVENQKFGFTNGSRLKVKISLERKVHVNDSEYLSWQVSKVIDTEMCENFNQEADA